MARPTNVGIHAMDVYFPTTYVSQTDLEEFDGVSAGKYTIGLGQENMAVCGEREDINSVCLTAMENLLEKYGIGYDQIGRLEVGTETIVDKSKAVKTTLMSRFNEHGLFDVEGIDSKNACYGGTAAVLNSLAWVESSSYDGRYAMVVCGDIAVYEPGPARPTGGAGVFAMLIGPDAPLVVEPGVRGTHMEDVYDFYKPTMVSEYPRVDGHLSNACYLRALDGCYNRYADRYEKAVGEPFSLSSADYSVFHAPYNKLVQKSFGRYLWNDWLRNPTAHPELDAGFQEYAAISADESYTDRAFLKHLVNISKERYGQMVQPTELITKQCGNSYCGSTYAGLLSLISEKQDELDGKRVLLFSYGSGLAATQFSIKVADGAGVKEIAEKADVHARLADRTKITPEEFTAVLAHREESYTKFDYSPSRPVSDVAKGTYYLTEIDALERRHYARALHTSAAPLLAAAQNTAAGTAPRMVHRQGVRALPRFTSLMAPAVRLARRVFHR